MKVNMQMIRKKGMEFLHGNYSELIHRPEGNRYEGPWLNGKQHGIGWYTNKNGEKRQGVWENGKRIKWINK